jgi:dihydroflavonol-4-reductase
MKYFITGITGFLGKNLVSGIRKMDKETKIIGLTRKPENLGLFKDSNTTLLTGTLNDNVLLAENLKAVNSVIHLAALINDRDKDLIYKTNVEGTKSLVNACLETGVKNIIFISSRLADPIYKKSIYGQSKFAAEEIIKKSGLNFIILRPALIYGENDRDLSQLTEIIRKFPLIPILGNGNYLLQPIHVKKVVEVIIFILKNNIFNGKTYNLAGEPISYNELVDKICKQLNKRVIKIHLPIKLGKFLIRIYEKIFPNPLITTAQIDNLINAKPLDATETKNDLNFNIDEN